MNIYVQVCLKADYWRSPQRWTKQCNAGLRQGKVLKKILIVLFTEHLILYQKLKVPILSR